MKKMQVYKRSFIVMIKGLVMAPCAAVLVYIVLSIFVDNYMILLGVSALVFLAILYITIFSENIRFEVNDDGTMRYFKKGKPQKIYILEEYRFGYNSKSDSISSDIILNILHIESGEEEYIDCSPIGLRKFSDMYEKLKKYSKEETEVLKA